MHFASPVPLWLAAIIAAALVAAAIVTYRRPLAPLGRAQRATLIALRAGALLALLLFLCRPMILAAPTRAGDVAVPILVDASRSMAIPDAANQARLAQAVSAVAHDVIPAVTPRFTPDVYAVGQGAAPAALDSIRADAGASNLTAALAAVRDRYRGRPIAGIVLLSDGGDTSAGEAAVSDVPVFALGVGSPEGLPDREITALTAGDPHLDHSAVDVRVTVTSHGFGRAPFDLRLSANGRVVDTRKVTPVASGAPIDEVFAVPPAQNGPTVITADISPNPDERIVENNTRSVLVSPPGRRRRVLMLEGAPGFEQSFLTRALSADRDLEVDSIVRKGKNDAGQDTFFVQAPASRAPALTSGFPATRDMLFSYDAVVVANLSGDVLTRAQMSSLADFVSTRGGGMLVLGGMSLAEHGLTGTPLEPLIPVELGDRRGGLVRTSFGVDLAGPAGVVVPTPEGERHPIMRFGTAQDDVKKKWAALPALAAAAPLGGPRAGAQVLAVTTASGGDVYPVIAVQQYGDGRTMVFGGEASWRWRMLLPSTDRSYELFWRGAARWLAAPSPDPVSLSGPAQPQPGEPATLSADVRNAAFEPVSDARITATITTPEGEERPIVFRQVHGGSKFAATFTPDQTGAYRVQLEASRGTAPLGAAEQWFYAGGVDREMADPRLNEAALRRIVRASGGRYAPLADAGQVAKWLDARAPGPAGLEPRDLWHSAWTIAVVATLLCAEWALRRRWGLR